MQLTRAELKSGKFQSLITPMSSFSYGWFVSFQLPAKTVVLVNVLKHKGTSNYKFE